MGTGIINTVHNIWKRDREQEMAANLTKYWENNWEILNSSKTINILRAIVAEKVPFKVGRPLLVFSNKKQPKG